MNVVSFKIVICVIKIKMTNYNVVYVKEKIQKVEFKNLIMDPVCKTVNLYLKNN